MPRMRSEIEHDLEMARSRTVALQDELMAALLQQSRFATPSVKPRICQSKEEVFEVVREVLMDALAVDHDEVVLEARLSEHLGAQSIDYLEITFKLEMALGIKIPKGELLPDNLFSNPEFVQNSKMTPNGLAELKIRMPFADISKFEADPDINKFVDIFTVDTLVRYVWSRVQKSHSGAAT
jgi:acyl carrier protein